MPAIKNIAAAKKKGQHDFNALPRKPLPPSMPWRKKKSGSGSNVVKAKKAKNGRVKKVTKLTVEFVAAADKKVKLSHKPKLL